MPAERRDKPRRRGLRQVLGNLEADNEVKTSSQVEAHLQVGCADDVRRDLELIGSRVPAFEAYEIADPRSAEAGQPLTSPATGI